MKLKEYVLISLVFFLVTAVFFYKIFLHGYIPFPGDLLVAEYSPWKTYTYLGYNPGSYPNKAQFFDTLRQLYPWRTFAVHQIKQGNFPLWNPYNFSGTPLFANFQSAVLYPFALLYVIFPRIIIWSLLIFLQPFLAGFFTYCYCKKIKLSFWAAFLASISYGFSSFMIVWLEYNTIGRIVLWLPFFLLLIEYMREKKSIFVDILFIFTILCTILAGHPQLAAYSFIFVFFYAWYRQVLNRRIIILALLSIGIASIQIIPGIELIRYSARSAHNYIDIIKVILIQWWQLVMLFIPDFFGNPATRNYVLNDTYVGNVMSIGILPLFFAFFGIFHWKKQPEPIRFFFFALFVVLILIMRNPITEFLYRFELPFISSSSSNLAVFLFCFSLSILAAYGFDSFLKNKDKKIIYAFSLGWIFLFCIIAAIAYIVPFRSISFKATIYEFLFLLSGLLMIGIIHLFHRVKTYAIICLFILILFGSWRAFEKFIPFVPRQLVFPAAPVISFLKHNAGIQRAWGFGNAHIEANFATQLGFYSPEGYDPLYPKWYGEFIQASKMGSVVQAFTDKTRSDAVIALSSAKDFAKNPYRLRILQLLGVSYILDRVENGSTEITFPPKNFSLVYSQNNWKIYNYSAALPRFFLASSYQTYTTASDFSAKFFANSFDIKKTLLLERGFNRPMSATKMESHLISYTPNTIVIRTRSNGAALLFLSDTYYPGWIVTIDGKQEPIYKTDYAFRSVLVPAGEHRVMFSFRSQSFILGFYISIVCIIVVMVYFFISRPQIQNNK